MGFSSSSSSSTLFLFFLCLLSGFLGWLNLYANSFASSKSNRSSTLPLPSKAQYSVTTFVRKYTSCDTTRTPPLNSLTASIKASTVSRSKWLVGSSMMRRWGWRYTTMEKARRDFCPPESPPIFCKARLPLRPREPRWLRISWSFISGNNVCMYWKGDCSWSNRSAWCWSKEAHRA